MVSAVTRFLITVFLFAVILIMCLFIFLYYFLNLKDPGNGVNLFFRPKLLTIPLLKTVFRLHQVGDARFGYAMPDNYRKLDIAVYRLPDESLTDGTMDLVIREISRVVAKPGGITVRSPVTLPLQKQQYSDSNLKNLIDAYPAPRSEKTIGLNIFLLNTYAEIPTYAGLVMNEDTVFLFMDSLREISANTRTTQKAEMSTILHEFGHLLGAEHTDSSDCLMSEAVEDTSFGILPARISESYCDSDMIAIREALGEI